MVARLKKNHSTCQLCEQTFTNEDEKHVHHIEGESEVPALATDEKNLIIIKGWIHKDYHDWLNKKGLAITRPTLKKYAKINSFSIVALEAQ